MKLHRRFNFLVIFRLLLLIGNVILIATILGDDRLFFNQIILTIVLVLQVYDLIRFVNHTNRELSRFFLAIRHSDFSITFKQSELGSSFRELYDSMVGVIDAYKIVKIEKEAQFHFLQMLVNQLHIGLIALQDHEITLMNPTAERILGVDGVRNWKLIQQLNSSFTKEIELLGDNGRKLIEIKTHNGSRFLSLDVSTLVILGRSEKLITFQDINSEIEQKEIEAWHKLIRILTHEIMNSVTPISSLTETMQTLLENKAGTQKKVAEISDENISDIRFALQTIQKRSEGLLNFIENYRKMTRVPKPNPEMVSLKTFLQRIENLMAQELSQKGIKFEISEMPDIRFEADPVLLEQVIINLVTNSIHALDNRAAKKIILSASTQGNYLTIEVRDNGKGISSREITEIFTPFFSTRKEGSGIGLSLSKQIIAMHGGSIKVKSEIDVGTSMFIQLKLGY